jgi:tetratricopeptide (TPR) repeat protein
MKAAAYWLCSLAALGLPATASAWSPFRAQSPQVKQGNELMAEQKYEAALEAYDEAARKLPDAPGVQLDRGLALLAQDLTEQSKEAFMTAADPSAPANVRADAYYDLGLAFAREGDALSQQEAYDQASAHFREAADAFKRALRLRPGDRNAAWNFEYVMKRIREQEEKRQQQQDQQQDQKQQEQQQQQQQEQEQQGQSQERRPDQGQPPNEQPREEPIAPDDVQRFLDALEQNEENLPLQRARRRNAGRRPPEKDW